MPASCSSRRDHSPTHSMLFPFPERLIFEQSARRAPASLRESCDHQPLAAATGGPRGAGLEGRCDPPFPADVARVTVPSPLKSRAKFANFDVPLLVLAFFETELDFVAQRQLCPRTLARVTSGRAGKLCKAPPVARIATICGSGSSLSH